MNPACDLDLEDSNKKLSHNTPARDDALIPSLVEKVRNFRRLFFKDLSPHCDLDLELDRDPNVLHETRSVHDAPIYQVSLRKVKWFKRYCPDKYSRII